MEDHQLSHWINELTQVSGMLDQRASIGGGVAFLVGADPLSMERDPELQQAVLSLGTVIDEMRKTLERPAAEVRSTA